MYRPYRQRRGPYALARPSPLPGIIRFVVLVVLAGLILFFTGRWVLGFFGNVGSSQRAKIDVMVENRSVASVAIDGGLLQRIEGATKLYAGDRITTGGNGHVRLSLVDGTLIRMDEQSEIAVEQSEHGDDATAVELSLERGGVWITTPQPGAFTGSVQRTLTTPAFTLTIPAATKAMVSDRSVRVFESGGEGIRVEVDGISETVFVAEGQHLDLPTGQAVNDVADLLSLRSALRPEEWNEPFIRENMGLAAVPQTGSSEGTTTDLTVTAPQNNAVLSTGTVKVTGTVGLTIERVRVNGYPASLNTETRTFTQEIALREGADTQVLIEALDDDGSVVAQTTRNVRWDAAALAAPVVKKPVAGGGTYTTDAERVEISGDAPAGIAGIMVNEYRLQLFKPGDKTWAYVASLDLKNLTAGTNIFDITTIGQDGRRSVPVRVTIIQGQGQATSAGSNAGASSVVSETQLPNNTPTKPGTLRITGPTAGTSHTETGTGFLLEGTTDATTASVWVNGYRLQLYKAGSTRWNYIADTKFGNLKRGTNVYRVVVRDSGNQILDTLEYTVTLDPQ